MTLRGFADELSMDSPAPGGGSVAALCGALSAALSSMVANLTVGKKGYEAVADDMIATAVRGQALKDALLEAVDRDTRAFNKVMEAFRLPKATPEQAAEKDRALEAANKEATLVPLEVLEKAVEAVALARTAAAKGNTNSVSDAGVAGLVGQAAGEGAYYNVLINLGGDQGRRVHGPGPETGRRPSRRRWTRKGRPSGRSSPEPWRPHRPEAGRRSYFAGGRRPRPFFTGRTPRRRRSRGRRSPPRRGCSGPATVRGPPATETTATAAEAATAVRKLAATWSPAAAGMTIRAATSRMPTTFIPRTMVTAVRTMSRVSSRPTLTPAARADSRSKVMYRSLP